MALSDLTEFEFLTGFFALIFVLISLIIGLMIFSKYFSTKQKTFITVGLTWIFLSTAYLSRSIDFILVIFFNTYLDEFIFLLLMNIFIPLVIICWSYSFSSLVFPHLRKKIVFIFTIVGAVYEILLIIFLLTNPRLVGFVEGFYAEFAPFTISLQLLAIIVFLIGGIFIIRNSFRSDDQKIRWKGKFLMIAFISFTCATVYDSAAPLTPVLFTIMRLVLISSSIEFYLGFFLPDSIAKRLVE